MGFEGNMALKGDMWYSLEWRDLGGWVIGQVVGQVIGWVMGQVI